MTRMTAKRVTRLIKLLKTLQYGVEQHYSGLAKAFGVERRTILRDFETLRQAGVPVHFNRKAQQYSILRSSYLPPTDFTADEALALLAIAAEFGKSRRVSLYEAAYSAAVSSRPVSHRYCARSCAQRRGP